MLKITSNHDKYVIECWLRLHNRLMGASFVIIGWPDKDSSKKNIDAICRDDSGSLIAIEHTLIQPFEGEKADTARFMRTLASLENHGDLLQKGYTISASQPVGAIPTGLDWKQIADELLRQLTSVLPTLAEGSSSVTIKGANWTVDLRISKTRTEQNSPGRVLTARAWPGDPRPELILKALKEKIPKLSAYAVARKILLFERDAIAGTTESQFEQLTENPALDLKGPKITLCPTLPFSREEMVRILAAADQYKEEMPSHGIENGRRIRGLVLLLRYSGMRIGDGVNFSTDRLEGNRLFLYTQKTGVPVNTILPGFVLSALEATPKVTEKFFFWSGRGKLESIVRSWQTRLRKLFKLASVPNGHAHRFHDTFAVELLLAGVPIERVSILLGHQSVRITEKHYAPWVRSRQEQLEADLASAWSRDPLVLSQSGVHQRYTERSGPTTHSSSIRKTGARGGSRTHMRKNPRRILSPQRLPFRHPGRADKEK